MWFYYRSEFWPLVSPFAQFRRDAFILLLCRQFSLRSLWGGNGYSAICIICEMRPLAQRACTSWVLVQAVQRYRPGREFPGLYLHLFGECRGIGSNYSLSLLLIPSSYHLSW